MTDFTEKEREVTLAALKNLITRYGEFRGMVEAKPLQEAADECLTAANSAVQKLNGEEAPERKAEESPERKDNACIFIYVPDGIYDQELEEEFRSRIPKHLDYPDTKNFFWSKKYYNFVVRGFEKEAEKAIEARYNGEKVVDKNPEFASKPNTWQIVDKGNVKSN